jgi:hypothetical protein
MDHFEQIGTRGFYRPIGRVNFEHAIESMARSMVHARACGCSDLLINVSGYDGLASPDIFVRHQLAVRWAESAGSKLHVAIVASRDLVDPDKITITMAQNRGVTGDVFNDETAAIRWLDTHTVRAR